jgi:rare lipoprotein A
MKYILRGVIILLGIIVVFMLLTACAPSRALTRNNQSERNEVGYDKLDDEFSYRDQERDYDNSAQDDRKKAYRERERVDRDDYNIKSNRYSKRELSESDDEREFDKNERVEEEDIERFYQRGNASWYGREFHGRITASGERFNMNEMTAAHRTLPFGTVLLVKNLENKKTVRVKVNDRGPYKDGRIIDLSFAAAKRIDMLKSGEAMVGIKVLGKMRAERYENGRTREKDELIEPVAGDNDERDFGSDNEYDRDSYSKKRSYGNFSIQAGAFYSKRNAFKLKKRLEMMFNNPVAVIRDSDFYKVRIEGVRDKREALRFKRLLKDEDISSYIVQENE